MSTGISGSEVLGKRAVVAGFVNASAAGSATLTTTDGAATMTRSVAGDYTINFNQAFNASPMVFTSAVNTTATDQVTVELHTISTTSARLLIKEQAGTGSPGLVDNDFYFMAIGNRNL